MNHGIPPRPDWGDFTGIGFRTLDLVSQLAGEIAGVAFIGAIPSQSVS